MAPVDADTHRMARPRLPAPTDAVLAVALPVLALAACLRIALAPDLAASAAPALVLVGLGLTVRDRRRAAGSAVAVVVAWVAALVAASSESPAPATADVLAAVATVAAGVGLGVLAHQLRGADARELEAVRAQAQEASVQDRLTGVVNRRGLDLVGERIVEAARRGGNAVHCTFVDVTDLARVNEALGHDAGDRVLVAVADALTGSVRATDVVSRWHGDDFAVVGPGPGMPPLELERRVRDRLIASAPVDADVWAPAVSAGASMLAPWDSGSLATLLLQAERELESRRTLRRNRGMRRRADRSGLTTSDGTAVLPPAPPHTPPTTSRGSDEAIG